MKKKAYQLFPLTLILFGLCCHSFAASPEHPVFEDNHPDEQLNKLLSDSGKKFSLSELQVDTNTVDQIFSASSSAWRSHEFEKSYILHIIAMSRLRALAILNTDSGVSDKKLEFYNKQRASLISSWALGDVDRTIELIELAVNLDDQLNFSELDNAVTVAQVGTLGGKYAVRVGRQPFIDLIKFLSENKEKIYQVRRDKSQPIRDANAKNEAGKHVGILR